MANSAGYFNFALALGNSAPGFALLAFKILIFFSLVPHSFSEVYFIHNLIVNIVVGV